MLRIGLFGLGTVGQGLLNILRSGNYPIEVTGIVDRSYKKKKDILDNIMASDDPEFLLKNDNVDVVVECIGGVDLPLYIVREAIDSGKDVVTANKALLAEHGYPLLNKAAKDGVRVGFEAAVAGGIPIIRNLQSIFANEPVHTLEGILNGTSNFILTKMRRERADYSAVLAEAQKLGMAEADPTLDVNGMDATHKLAILASLIQGEWVEFHHIPTRGIDNINLADIYWSDRMGYRIRLVATYDNSDGQVFLSVEPTLIRSDHFLWDIEFENNAILLHTEYSDSHLLVGKGAGSLPTAFSVLSDLVQLTQTSKPEPIQDRWAYAKVTSLDSVESAFYLRFRVNDQPGVLASIANILGDLKISIASVQQEDASGKSGQVVDLVIVTHCCSRRALGDALTKIAALDATEGDAVYMPIHEK